MSKIELDSVASGFNLEVINTNFQKIEDELNNKVLYRANPSGQPNQMTGNLDMNGGAILNASNISGGGGGASTASAVSFTPTGSISSTNVQDALVEVANEGAQPAINYPLAAGVAAQIGTSARYAREDHIHPDTGSGGGSGTPGTSTAIAYAYKRAASPPLDNPGDIVYNFVVAAIVTPSTDALANGWTKTIPSGTDPLYVTAASASSTATTDAIAASEWSTPVVLAANGSAGLNAATVFIYQRNGTGSTPALPTAITTYTFTPPGLTGLNNGWSTTVPAASGGKYLFVSTATAVSNTSTDSIGPSEWAAVQLMAQDGATGPAGPTGSNGINGQRGTLTVYQSGQTSWSDAVATSAIQAVGLGGPYDRDVVTEYGTNFSQTRFYSSGSWIVLTAVIDGNLLVTGTVSAAKINGGTLTGIQVGIGSGHTPTSYAFEVTNVGTVWTDNLNGGLLRGSNNYSTSVPAIQGSSNNFSGSFGVYGLVDASNSNGGAGGVKGASLYSGTSGTVGPTGSYDFYATGSGTNYGPFTGAHDALILNDNILDVGDIVVDMQCICRGVGVSNTIFEVARSTTPNQKGVVGVVAVPISNLQNPPAAFTIGFDNDWNPIVSPTYNDVVATHKHVVMNALGEGMMNVIGENGNIQKGDLIVASSTSGKGMRQSDDIVHNYTVARAREDVSFTGSEVKQVACIYLCG